MNNLVTNMKIVEINMNRSAIIVCSVTLTLASACSAGTKPGERASLKSSLQGSPSRVEPQSSIIAADISAVLLSRKFTARAAELSQDAAQRGRTLDVTGFVQDEQIVYVGISEKITADIDGEWLESGYLVGTTSQDMVGNIFVDSVYFSPAGSQPSSSTRAAGAAVSRELSALLLASSYRTLVEQLTTEAEQFGRALAVDESFIDVAGEDGVNVYLRLTERLTADLANSTMKGYIVGHTVPDMQGNLHADGVYFSPAGTPPPAAGVRN